MQIQNTIHPTVAALRDYVAGALDELEALEIERHLGECPTCCEAVDSLPQGSLISVIRSAKAVLESPTCVEDSTATHEIVAHREAVVHSELARHSRYKLIRRLGSGGMGVVYEAEHRLMNRRVAIKVIQSRLMHRPAAVARFRREVQAAARLDHPNIVRAFDAEQAGGVHFLVMEYVDGITVSELVSRDGPLDAARACDLAIQTAAGLQHAHERGMVHRDIKPQNLIVTASPTATNPTDCCVKILDFGLASLRDAPEKEESFEIPGDHTGKVLDEQGLSTERSSATASGLTSTGLMLGTADYVAPEQIRSPRDADIRADLYSLGCTLYYMLTGRVPFKGDSVATTLILHIESAAVPLSELRPDVPPALGAAVHRMLAKNPAERFQTPTEAADSLRPFGSRGRSPIRQSPLRWVIAAVALIALTCLAFQQVVRVRAANGWLEIVSADPKFQVTVKQGSATLHDHTTDRSYRLVPGQYELELTEPTSGLRLFTKRFSIERGGKTVVDVRLELDRAEAARDANQTTRDTTPGRPILLKGHKDLVSALAISHDSRRALSGSERDATLILWDLERARPIGAPMKPPGWIRCIAFSPDGRSAAVGCSDRFAHLLDLETQRSIREFGPHADWVMAVAFSPDGQQLLTAGGSRWDGKWVRGADTRIHLWDVATGKQRGVFAEVHTDGITGLEFLAGGEKAISSSRDKTMVVWDVVREKPVKTLTGHTDSIFGMAVTKDGRRAVSGGGDNNLILWDLEKEERLCTLSGHHETGIHGVGITADAGFAASAGGHEQSLRIWDLKSSKQYGPFEGHPHQCWRVAVSPDGRFVLTAGGVGDGNRDYDLRLWELSRLISNSTP
jgi:serine/threonine protein kinase/WD40 repeat protein